MNQTFQFHQIDFNSLTEKILGIKYSSFKDEKTIGQTLKNCFTLLKIDHILEVDEISFSHGNIGDRSFTHFTISKLENISDKEFLRALKYFNV